MPILDDKELSALSAALALDKDQGHARGTARPVSLVGAEATRRAAALQRSMDTLPDGLAERFRALTRRNLACLVGPIEPADVKTVRAAHGNDLALAAVGDRMKAWLFVDHENTSALAALILCLKRVVEENPEAPASQPPSELEKRLAARALGDVFDDIRAAAAKNGLELPSVPRQLGPAALTVAEGVLHRARIEVSDDASGERLLFVLVVQGEPARQKRGVGARAVLPSVELDVVAELGGAKVSLDEVARLRPGDVIPLDVTEGEAMTLRVGESARFACRVEPKGGRLVARIAVKPALPAPMSELRAGNKR